MISVLKLWFDRKGIIISFHICAKNDLLWLLKFISCTLGYSYSYNLFSREKSLYFYILGNFHLNDGEECLNLDQFCIQHAYLSFSLLCNLWKNSNRYLVIPDEDYYRVCTVQCCSQSVTTCGSWALEMWLVLNWDVHKTHPGFQRLYEKGI